MVKNDLEKFAPEELQLENILINTIAAKKKKKFVDPYPYNPNADAEEETNA